MEMQYLDEEGVPVVANRQSAAAAAAAAPASSVPRARPL